MSGILAPRGIRYVLLACAGLGTIFLFLLATASANTELFASNYNLLLVLNGTMVVVLMCLVAISVTAAATKLENGSVRVPPRRPAGVVVRARCGGSRRAALRRVRPVPREEHRIVV